MNNDIVAIEVKEANLISNLEFKNDFTTNKNYIGHFNNIPVYINNNLQQGEIKQIMKQERKELPEGNYKAFVAQVYEKKSEDGTKEYTVAELDIKDQKDRYYVTFFKKGYSDIAIEIAQKRIQDILDYFDIKELKELEGKEVSLNIKKNKAGYLNPFIYPPKNFYEWDMAGEIPCTITKLYSKQDKTIVAVKYTIKGIEYDDYVSYRNNNEWEQKELKNITNKLHIKDLNFAEINQPAIFAMKFNPSKTDSSKIFKNKHIKFPRQVKTSHWA